MAHEEDTIDAAPAALPLDGTLDLHTFAPSDVASVVEEYVSACSQVGVLELRIVHGKGVGVLREITHGVLGRHPKVVSFRLGDERSGGWGATLVEIKG